MEPYVYANFMFCATANTIRDATRATYSLKNNASLVFEVYEVFNLRQGDKSIIKYWFRDMINELNQYHPLPTDLEIARRQHQELYVCKFLSGLSTTLQPHRG